MTLRLEPLSDDHLWMMRLWRNAIKDYCREYRDISEYHQDDWFANYCKQSITPFPTTMLWEIWDEDGDEPIGVGGWTYINWVNRRAELTYYLAPEMRGKGLGREALRLLIGKARDEMGMHTLYGEVHGYNEASLKCMHGAGFTNVGVYKDAAWKRGKYQDIHLLEMVL